MASYTSSRHRRRQGSNGPNILATFIAGSFAISLIFMVLSIHIGSSINNDVGGSGYIQKHPFIADLNNDPKQLGTLRKKTGVVGEKKGKPRVTDREKHENDNNNLVQIINSKETHPGPNYHMVFSTDCSSFQRWQSYLLFYSAYKVGQPGTVTRIASGCEGDDIDKEKKFHEIISKHMSPNFKLHLTPHFSKVKDGEGNDTGKDYKFFNKPFGLLHWLEHAVEKVTDDDIVILLDPDQVLTRPITNDFSNLTENLLIGDNPKTKVEHGSPFAQKYGYGTKWTEFDLETITNSKDTPARAVNHQDAANHYPSGPPYLATVKDMHVIAKNWAEFVPRVHAEHPHLLAEMFAFCIAAAHAKLPFQISISLMVSESSSIRGEGWALVHNIEDDKICSPTVMEDAVLPSVLHYCQRYIVGKNFFGKRKMPHNIFTCESPLLNLPPTDMAKMDYFIPPPPHRPHEEHKPLDSGRAKRDTFMICALTRLVNDAALFYQKTNCDSDKDMSVAIDLWTGKTIQVSK
jgi:hypothetical protein